MSETSKRERLVWLAINLVLCGLVVVNMNSVRASQSSAESLRRDAAGVVDAASVALNSSVAVLGEKFPFGAWERIAGPELSAEPRRRLLLILGEAGCSACEVSALRFVGQMADSVGLQHTILVAISKDPNYSRALIRQAEIRSTVLADEVGESAAWLRLKEIKSLPFLAVLDEGDRIVAANAPLPGRTSWTTPFERAAAQLLTRPAQLGGTQ